MVIDNPPSYDSATGSTSSKDQPSQNQLDHRKRDASKSIPLVPSHHAPQLLPGPSYNPHKPLTTIHHYVHPVTGEHIATPLPPDHPEMICLQQGDHIRRTKFGLLGIMAAVFFFPLGVALCLIDRRVKCDRCGRILEDGVTCG